MIKAELLEQIENYLDVHYISLEWLEQKKKEGWHFSLSMRLGDAPEEDSVARTIINHIKEKLGMLESRSCDLTNIEKTRNATDLLFDPLPLVTFLR